jgi:hypothetical protein
MKAYWWDGTASNSSEILRKSHQLQVRLKILNLTIENPEKFNIKNYGFNFNPLSFREFANVYND